MADDIKYTSYDEGEASPENELKELQASLTDLQATGADALSQQAIANAQARIAELKKDNPHLS
jgi:hypothetical protein